MGDVPFVFAHDFMGYRQLGQFQCHRPMGIFASVCFAFWPNYYRRVFDDSADLGNCGNVLALSLLERGYHFGLGL